MSFIPSPPLQAPNCRRSPSLSTRSRIATTRAVAAPPRRPSPPRRSRLSDPNNGDISTVINGIQLFRIVGDTPVVVLKIYSRGCRACIGVAPRFKKLAHAYAGQARFVEMECEEDISAKLGVSSLPFFAVWKEGRLLSAEPISFNRIGKLSDRVSTALDM